MSPYKSLTRQRSIAQQLAIAVRWKKSILATEKLFRPLLCLGFHNQVSQQKTRAGTQLIAISKLSFSITVKHRIQFPTRSANIPGEWYKEVIFFIPLFSLFQQEMCGRSVAPFTSSLLKSGERGEPGTIWMSGGWNLLLKWSVLDWPHVWWPAGLLVDVTKLSRAWERG